MSIVVVARLFPKPGRTAEFLSILAEAAPAVHAEPGCELYAAHEAADGTIIMIEKWTHRADLDAHLAGAPLRASREARAELETRPVQVEVLEPRPAGDADRGAL